MSMKIGIIGAGKIGATAAQLFVKAGREVALSNSRGPETLRELVSQLGEKARALSIEETAKFGDVILIAIPLGSYKSLPASAFDGKIVIDANNYYPGRDGHIPELDNGQATSSQLLQQHLPGARVVKAFNTIWFEHLRTQGNIAAMVEDRRAIFIAGDDKEAKEAVTSLIHEIGFAAVDTGSLREGGKRQQPDTELYNKVLTEKEALQLL
jgi:8-hydroxy-5-deazaflavin:NADPH oxidoreductase